MSVATNYAGILRNVTLGQAGSFIGFMTLAASLFLVAFELKQGRDIAEVELMTKRYEMYKKVTGIYDLDYRLRKEEVARKRLEEGLEALSPAELSIAWATVEGIFIQGELGYETYKMGLKSEEAMERDLLGYASMICLWPTLSEEIWADREFGSQLKKRAATLDCSQLPSPFLDERLKAR